MEFTYRSCHAERNEAVRPADRLVESKHPYPNRKLRLRRNMRSQKLMRSRGPSTPVAALFARGNLRSG